MEQSARPLTSGRSAEHKSRHTVSGDNREQTLHAQNADAITVNSRDSAVTITAKGAPTKGDYPLQVHINGDGNALQAHLDVTRTRKWNTRDFPHADTITHLNGKNTQGALQGGVGNDWVHVYTQGGQTLTLDGGAGKDKLNLPGHKSDWTVDPEVQEGYSTYTNAQGDIIKVRNFEEVLFMPPVENPKPKVAGQDLPGKNSVQ